MDIVRDSVVDHLERNELIHDTQHGFRRGRSCLTNLLIFLDKVTPQVDEGHDLDVIYLDFAKAFDKVPRQRLLLKLENHEIKGRVLSLGFRHTSLLSLVTRRQADLAALNTIENS